jgi:hypothetical protein
LVQSRILSSENIFFSNKQRCYLEKLLLLHFLQIHRFLAPKQCFYSRQGGPSVNKVPLGVKFLGQN